MPHSAMYAEDMFSLFKKNGILDNNTGLRFREHILEKGGSINPNHLVFNFLNREPNNSAFIKSLGLIK